MKDNGIVFNINREYIKSVKVNVNIYTEVGRKTRESCLTL
jgi:hypothetical protein